MELVALARVDWLDHSTRSRSHLTRLQYIYMRGVKSVRTVVQAPGNDLSSWSLWCSGHCCDKGKWLLAAGRPARGVRLRLGLGSVLLPQRLLPLL